MIIKLYPSPPDPAICEWHKWYAWHPVIFDGWKGLPKLVWLHPLERRYLASAQEWIYRLPKEKHE